MSKPFLEDSICENEILAGALLAVLLGRRKAYENEVFYLSSVQEPGFEVWQIEALLGGGGKLEMTKQGLKMKTIKQQLAHPFNTTGYRPRQDEPYCCIRAVLLYRVLLYGTSRIVAFINHKLCARQSCLS